MREDDQIMFRTIDEFVVQIYPWDGEELELHGDNDIAMVVLSYTLRYLVSDGSESSVISNSAISGTYLYCILYL